MTDNSIRRYSVMGDYFPDGIGSVLRLFVRANWFTHEDQT